MQRAIELFFLAALGLTASGVTAAPVERAQPALATVSPSASLKACNADVEYRETATALRKADDLIGKGRLAAAENLLDASTRKLVAYETSRKLYLQHPPGVPDLDDSGLRLAYAEGAAQKSGGAGPVDLKMSMLKKNLQTLCGELTYRSGHR